MTMDGRHYTTYAATKMQHSVLFNSSSMKHPPLFAVYRMMVRHLSIVYATTNMWMKQPSTALDILKLLIEEYPEAAWHADDYDCRPIHYACKWRSYEFCQVLVNAAPDSVSRVDEDGMTPLHYLCSYSYREVDDTAAMQVLNLLIDKYPKRSGIGIVMVIFQFM